MTPPMIDGQTITIIIALVTMAAGGVWKLSRVEKALRDEINKSHEAIEEKQQQHSREFGETVRAIREKVGEVELYAANNYVRRDGFYKVQDNLENSIRALGDKIDARLERMEVKIDSKT